VVSRCRVVLEGIVETSEIRYAKERMAARQVRVNNTDLANPGNLARTPAVEPVPLSRSDHS